MQVAHQENPLTLLWDGSWQLQQPTGTALSGKMTFIDETKATYTYDNGRIFFYAIDDLDKWEGYWVENSGARDCADKRMEALTGVR